MSWSTPCGNQQSPDVTRGPFWFVGSAVIGIVYERSVAATIVFCVACELAPIPMFFAVWRQYSLYRMR
jgi:hypothetical protein